LGEIISKELNEEIQAAAEKTAKEEYFELPEALRNYKLHWSTPQDTTAMTLTILGIIAALMVWLLGDRELDNRMKKRQEQLLIDYPEIINKFTLLINAGMTVKQAWSKIAEDYYIRNIQQDQDQCKKLIKKKSVMKMSVRKKPVIKRYAYEEMLITVNELKLGLSEGKAYEQYGRRLGLLPYIRFTSLITQNLKKGNKGFTELLRQEAMEAFENRKEIAKRLGEEAGTKLLVPMMLMLIIVFMIILVPAFISFQI
jgi:pilus assembly protein TadC